MFPRLFRILLLLLVLYTLLPSVALGQQTSTGSVQGAATLGVARIVETAEKNPQDGSILTDTPKGAALSSLAYDPQVVGVVSRDAAIILNSSGSTTGVPIISNGTVYILVSSRDGNIKKGDLLTTSTIPGVAVRAKKDGYVLGSALEDYSNSNPKQIDKIAAELNLHYFNSKPTILGTLSDVFKVALLPTKDSPTPVFKYIAAASVVVASFVLAFMTFGRTAAKGVEALGRNPAASKIIHLGIIINVTIVGIIVLAGLVVAFLILRL
ncbi:MAG: hypothetical protein ACM3IJ_04825 [Candidatus Levyibacteriota bacterium]